MKITKHLNDLSDRINAAAAISKSEPNPDKLTAAGDNDDMTPKRGTNIESIRVGGSGIPATLDQLEENVIPLAAFMKNMAALKMKNGMP